MKKYLVLLLTACLGLQATAQQTGSFNTSLTFNGSLRTLANFVPVSYTPAQPHKLVIGLHGLGDNAANYRNALVNGRSFQSAFPNTILICPDGGDDPGRDFYQPAGDEEIIDAAINFARTHYNIDTTEIILQGFSLGGRSAMKYGLEHTGQFKALLLNTPAIQGVKEVANNSAFTYNYTAAPEIPVYVTIGNNDPVYNESVNRAVAQLVANNGRVAYKIFQGDHTIPDFQTYPYMDFFDEPFSKGPDVGIYRMDVPERSCDGSVAGSILLQNTGNVVIDSVQLVYGIGNDSDTVSWSGNLVEHQSVLIDLPAYNASSLHTGTHNAMVRIIGVNQYVADTFTDFNRILKPVHIMTDSRMLPYSTGFSNENSLKEWAFHESGDYIMPFEYDDGALNSVNSIFIFDNAGTREEVISPKLNLSNQSNAYLHFNVDYNYVKYTANIFMDTVFADTLEVLVSVDCGATYSSVFKQAGPGLSGHEAPLMNPLSLQEMFVSKNTSKYRGFTVDLRAFTGQENVMVKFSYISALGGYIYLDDVAVNTSPVSVKETADIHSLLDVFPNPTTGDLKININADVRIKAVTVYNITGQEIWKQAGNNAANQHIDVSALPAGVYWMQVQTDAETINAKFVKQ